MVEMLSPGVYDREVDLSTVISGLSTTIGAIVGEAVRGPVGEPTLITTRTDFLRIFGEPTTGYNAMYTSLQFMERSNKLYFVRVAADDARYAGAKIYSDMTAVAFASASGPTEFPDPTGPTAANELFWVAVRGPGEWGHNYAITIINYDDYQTLDESDKVLFGEYKPTESDEFIVALYDKDLQTYDGNNVFLVSRNPNKKDLWNRSMYIEDVINENTLSLIDIQDNTSPSYSTKPYSTLDNTSVSYVTLGGGDNGSSVTSSEIIEGWDNFVNQEEYPVNILMSAGYTATEVLNKILNVCEGRTDCIGIVDPPFTTETVTEVVSWRNNTFNANSSYIATYWPWIYTYDRYTDKKFYLPPSGYVGAVFAYNDQVAEPWFAPAGFNRGIITPLGLFHNPTKGERDILYLNNINPIVSFPGEGIVVWGQKTMQAKASAFDRVNVRRLMNVLRTSINRAMRFSCFEPNDYFTRKYVRGILSQYLEGVQAARGLYDFQVICDESNNTPQVIDSNQLVIDIGLQPVRAAEFIFISYIVTRTGVSINEVYGITS